jgi:hypothetical protein
MLSRPRPPFDRTRGRRSIPRQATVEPDPRGRKVLVVMTVAS